MEIQYSIAQNSTGDGLNAIAMTAWYIDEEGKQIITKSEIKTGLTLQQCFDLYKSFIEENKSVLNG